jgi:hypothetical protein
MGDGVQRAASRAIIFLAFIDGIDPILDYLGTDSLT